MLKTLYLFLDSEILIDLISVTLAASFSPNSHHGSYTVHIARYQPGPGIDDNEPKKNHTQE